MYTFYAPPQSYYYIKKHWDNFPIQHVDLETLNKMNQFLLDNCKYMLIFMDYHFKEYIPILVTREIDDNIVIMFEFMLNVDTMMAEIYNICTHVLYRRKGYAKDLNKVFTELQNLIQCDLWIAVALNNPMYKIAIDTYVKMGFIDDIKIKYTTPSNIKYPDGFVELKRMSRNDLRKMKL